MDCWRCTDLVEPLLDPELDGGRALGQRDAVREHVRHCPACRERLEDTRRLFSQLNRMQREQAPAGFTAQVLARFGALLASGRRRRQRQLVVAWVLGGVSVAIVSTCLVWNDAAAAWMFAALGRMATWWYSWRGDLAEAVTHTVPMHMPLVATTLWRAGRLVLEACVPQLVACWFVMTATGVVVHVCASVRHGWR